MTAFGQQTGASGHIQETVDRLEDGSLFGAAREIHVNAGMFTEEVEIDKPVKMLGAQAGVSATMPRVGAETIVRPSVSDPDINTAPYPVLM